MIKTKGDYIAVKVPEGSDRFYYNMYSEIVCYKNTESGISEPTGFTDTVPAGEIIGLISEIVKDKPVPDYLWRFIKEDKDLLEFNQWLIIKKNG